MERRPMTHNKALTAAMDAYVVEDSDDMAMGIEAAIRAYIEARGLVLVPREIPAGSPLYGAVCDYVEWPTAFWNDMLAAAPDPFKEGE